MNERPQFLERCTCKYSKGQSCCTDCSSCFGSSIKYLLYGICLCHIINGFNTNRNFFQGLTLKHFSNIGSNTRKFFTLVKLKNKFVIPIRSLRYEILFFKFHLYQQPIFIKIVYSPRKLKIFEYLIIFSILNYLKFHHVLPI